MTLADRPQTQDVPAGDRENRRERPRFARGIRSHELQSPAHERRAINVAEAERAVSVMAGSILAVAGVKRRGLPGLLIATLGGGLIYRGATGHCDVYESLGVDTAGAEAGAIAARGVHVAESYLIRKSPEELYKFWRNFENLPRIMTHLEAVRVNDDTHSHWVAKAPGIAGGKVEWDAEITRDEPNTTIHWHALPGADVDNAGAIRFDHAPGDRGTLVHVMLDYIPPAGQIGRLVAKLFGEEPQQQIKEDLRNFKRIMETGEIPSIAGQPRGACTGLGKRRTE